MDIFLCQEIEICVSGLIWQIEYTHIVLFPLERPRWQGKREETRATKFGSLNIAGLIYRPEIALNTKSTVHHKHKQVWSLRCTPPVTGIAKAPLYCSLETKEDVTQITYYERITLLQRSKGEKKKGKLIILEPQCKGEGFGFTNYAG